MSRYNHYFPLTDNETEPRELGTQDLTMESALRVHTLNTIGRELNYGQNSTSLVQWVGSRETWVTFMNQTLCWSKATKLWVGSQELRLAASLPDWRPCSIYYVLHHKYFLPGADVLGARFHRIWLSWNLGQPSLWCGHLCQGYLWVDPSLPLLGPRQCDVVQVTQGLPLGFRCL